MEPRKITADVSVAGQITAADIVRLKELGIRSIICNRPDGEGGSGQPSFADIEAAAKAAGMEARYIPVVPGVSGDAETQAFATALGELPKPILAYCRSGNRSSVILDDAQALAAVTAKPAPNQASPRTYAVVIVGGGAAGIATAASLRARAPALEIALIEPAGTHYYQPGWTMVGAGIFTAQSTARPMETLIPAGITRLKAAVRTFEPEANCVVLDDGTRVGYGHLVVCPGLKLNWAGVEGLEATLGRNGVTSNYRYDLAPYTWKLVQELQKGPAIFTQPPMPIKCAGAPQKAMYLSADHWLRAGRLNDIDVAFYNAGGVLFGVPDYVPALMEYVNRYHAALNFNHNLTAIDGPGKKAWFVKSAPDGTKSTVEAPFAMIHVCPPQTAPDFIRQSPLADSAGWVDVDQGSMRHKKYQNIFALGDAGSTPNAKTAAAARKQAPIVAVNLLADRAGSAARATYNGYGSCPLTVERGKIVLAEFGYGGKLIPTFPPAVIDGLRPSTLAWHLKASVLPVVYWKAMLKGREWLCKPEIV